MTYRTLLLLLLFFIPSFLFAQNKMGVFVGPQASTARYLVKDVKQATEWKFGALAGMLFKIPFEKQLYFSPALYYSMKGYRVTLTQSSFPPGEKAKNNSTRFHTIDLAPLLHYDFSPAARGLFMRFGPALEFAVAGTEAFEEMDGKEIKRNMKFSFGDYGYVTASAVGQLGYETAEGYFISGHYAHGLGSANNADLGPIIRHRVAAITLGKYF